MPKKNKIKRIAERGSVKFHRIGKVTFWMTPSNRIFLIAPPDLVVFPYLSGGIVNFADQEFTPTDPVKEFLVTVLGLQRKIRLELPSHEEDAIAFQYHD